MPVQAQIQPEAGNHMVQFYERDEDLVATVARRYGLSHAALNALALTLFFAHVNSVSSNLPSFFRIFLEIQFNRDRGKPRGSPLPHHRTYGSVSGGSTD